MALKNRIPSRLTVERVLHLLNPKALQKTYVETIEAMRKEGPETVVSIDGKACFQRHRERGVGDAPYTISAWSKAHGISQGQVDVEGKSYKIRVIRERLDLLDIREATVTIDAICCLPARNRLADRDKEKIGLPQYPQSEPADPVSGTTPLCGELCAGSTLCRPVYKKSTVEKGHGRIK
ncbi:ISAs1 family transposase [Eubacteriales bacterium OttesenSCG-928-A19]|nr:ISAs1 family transposase [Eubacteriales bacterium OttesenSCG-928-A19]